MLRKEMCDIIKDFLNTYPVSQTELAVASGVTKNTINEIVMNKNPKRKLQSKTAVKIKEGMRKWTEK